MNVNVLFRHIRNWEGSHQPPGCITKDELGVELLQCFDTVGWAAGRASGL